MDDADDEPPWRATQRVSERRWEVVAAHSGLAHELARRHSPAPHCEDLAQEALVRLALHEQLDEARLPGLLCSIIKHLAIDLYRHQVVEQGNVGNAVLIATAEVSAEEVACDRSEAKWLIGQVARLPTAHSAALLARCNGQSLQEAAETLGLTPHALESAASRGRRTLHRWRIQGD